ncbi:hypothetical protein ACWGI8_42685 [Streptomyces sp. NPDC054841]
MDGVLKPSLPDAAMLGATRPFLEEHVRRRTLSLQNVRVIAGRAQGLIFSSRRVCGVRFSPVASASPAAAPEEELEADLVVDAMGRSSPLTRFPGRLRRIEAKAATLLRASPGTPVVAALRVLIREYRAGRGTHSHRQADGS